MRRRRQLSRTGQFVRHYDSRYAQVYVAEKGHWMVRHNPGDWWDVLEDGVVRYRATCRESAFQLARHDRILWSH